MDRVVSDGKQINTEESGMPEKTFGISRFKYS